MKGMAAVLNLEYEDDNVIVLVTFSHAHVQLVQFCSREDERIKSGGEQGIRGAVTWRP